ncbi:MAG: hypothetical protein LBF43_00225 [Puniceicoccales bacterium]|jgi:hypothetical protein|nr:hypothetical protein [Puniceicoccales bacterium]
MESLFWGKGKCILMFGLVSSWALHLQAYTYDDIQNFAQRCLALEDSTNQVVGIQLEVPAIRDKHLGIFSVTTAQGRSYDIKVIERCSPDEFELVPFFPPQPLDDLAPDAMELDDLALDKIELVNVSPNKVDDFRSSQLIHQHLQGKAIPPNLQFALVRFCQVVGREDYFYSLEDELPPEVAGQLLLWMPKASGDFIGNLRLEKVDREKVMLCLRSIAQAGTFLYQNGICLPEPLNPHKNRVNLESGVVTIGDLAGVRINPPNVPPSRYIFGGCHLLNQFGLQPSIVGEAIDFYDTPELKQCVIQQVHEVVADRFYYTLSPGSRNLPLDQIIALIDQYKSMHLIPPRIGIRANECLDDGLSKSELVSILLTNLPDEHKSALIEMHEQKISKAAVQCGDAPPHVCEAFRHYLSRVYGCRYTDAPFSTNWFNHPDQDLDRPIGDIIRYGQYGQITRAEVMFYQSLLPPERQPPSKYSRALWCGWSFIFK